MFYNKRLVFNITAFFVFVLSFPTFALEKAQLVSFLREYEASDIKCNGKVAYAIENGYPEVAEYFLLRGETINQYGQSYPLSFNPLEYRLAPHLRNTHMKHPLTTAIRKGYKNVAILMIQLGFGNKAEEYKIEYKKQFGITQEEIDRKNAMYVAIEECQDCYDIVLSLLENGFDVNTNKNISPLNQPNVRRGFEHYYQFNYVYTTPLLQAIATKKLDIAAMLLDYGADIEKWSNSPYIFENNGYRYPFSGSPLLKAVDDNFMDGVLLLLSYGANPLNNSNMSPLDRAVQKGYSDIVDVLFDSMNEKSYIR